MARTEHINPEILAWARETAGLSVVQAAEKLGLKDTAKASAAEKLLAMEAGERGLGRGMLEKAAATYRRPLITFYMAAPPSRGERGEDFRASSGRASARDDGMLDALVRDVRARQQMVREVLLVEEEAEALPFVGSSGVAQDAKSVANAIRATLGVTTASQRQARDPAALFTVLRGAAERIGAYVLLLGDLGSHHSDIGEDVFRGFALSDDIAPFVVINDNDAITARSFTLMHELAHVWIGASGVSGPLRDVSKNVVERFCNDVAGEFLLPSGEIGDVQPTGGIGVEDALALTADIARSWNVSQGVVAYRMVRNGWISDDVAAALFKAFADRWRSEKLRAKDLREPEDRGPDYFTVRRSRLGPALLAVVRRGLQGDALTHTKAAKILGVSPSSVDALLRDRPRAA
jgi:Zn-dependent peptidase ImmA (M78 family)